MLDASCHCGRITLLLPRRPRVVTACNCSYCRRADPWFAYYRARTVRVDADASDLAAYVWGQGMLRWQGCQRCGCFLFHRGAHHPGPESRLGVNLRMVDPDRLRGTTVNLRDGAAGTWAVLRRYTL